MSVYTRKKTPEGYTPYETLVVCSNAILGGGCPFEIAGSIPLWIGQGDKPKIWLSSVSAKGDSLQLIEGSVPAVTNVSSFYEDGVLGFAINGIDIIKVKEVTPVQCEIIELDFFPIGLAIQGDQSGLKVGGSNFSRNTFKDVGVMIMLG